MPSAKLHPARRYVTVYRKTYGRMQTHSLFHHCLEVWEMITTLRVKLSTSFHI